MQLTLTQPDDWHLHLRDGDMLAAVAGFSSQQFARAIIMPNLTPPVTTTDAALAYRQRILKHSEGDGFQPLMTLYLTEETDPAEVDQAVDSGMIKAFKLYPAGATTNSAAGVKDIARVYPLLERMQDRDMVLCVHGEVVDTNIDIFDREKVFIERTLSRLLRDFPELRIVMEHITTREAADFVRQGPATLAATLTPQHLLYDRNDLLAGGIKPHYYCLPILKRNTHKPALLQAATSGHPRFFLGTDSAPHLQHAKENACGCAGMFSAHAAIELYAEIFEQAGALDKLEAFASFHGADFYQLPRNPRRIVLRKENWSVPAAYTAGSQQIIPMNAGEVMRWKCQGIAE